MAHEIKDIPYHLRKENGLKEAFQDLDWWHRAELTFVIFACISALLSN